MHGTNNPNRTAKAAVASIVDFFIFYLSFFIFISYTRYWAKVGFATAADTLFLLCRTVNNIAHIHISVKCLLCCSLSRFTGLK